MRITIYLGKSLLFNSSGDLVPDLRRILNETVFGEGVVHAVINVALVFVVDFFLVVVLRVSGRAYLVTSHSIILIDHVNNQLKHKYRLIHC